VLDRKFELPLTSKLVGSAREVPVIVAALSPSALPGILPSRGEMPGRSEGVRPDHRRQQLIDAGVEILQAPTLENLLHILAERGMSELLVEGGAFAAKSFLEADLVDRIMLFESPVVVGEGGIETPLSRADIPGDYVLVSETAYGPDRCFDYERPL